MKGRTHFTATEAEQLRDLIRRKTSAGRTEQKRIRDAMRAMGFYISDFQITHRGFDAADFDGLLARGEIRVTSG